VFERRSRQDPDMSDSPTTANAALEELLAEARGHAAAGNAAQAVQVYQRAHAAAPDHPEALAYLGQRALTEGRHVEAKQLLERAVDGNGGDVQLLKNYGLACIGCQRLDEARFAFDRALTLEPDYFVARLYLGNVLQQLGHDAAALREYFAAVNKAQAHGRWLSPQTTPPGLQELVVHAMRFIDAGRKRLFGDVLVDLRARHGDAALARVDHALDIYLGERPANYPEPQQRPKFLFFPDIPTPRFYARELFDWYEVLERNVDVIRGEMLAVLHGNVGIEPFLKIPKAEDVPRFLGAGPQGPPAWDAFFFYRHGTRYRDNCERCPRTAAILDSLPLVRIRAHAPEICFSVLAPGTHILPHHGVTNTRLVTHLPLVVPEKCAISVGGEEHAWQEGRCVTFDDTFSHEAWNRSDSTRVVLITDNWNPYMTAIEREAVVRLVESIGDFNRECGLPEE
jgi:aspartate beta-hydroxylase